MTLIPASRTGFDSPFSIRTHFGEPSGPHPLMNEAWEALRKFVLYFHGQPVGTIVAVDHSSEKVLNYDQRIFPSRDLIFWLSMQSSN